MDAQHFQTYFGWYGFHFDFLLQTHAFLRSKPNHVALTKKMHGKNHSDDGGSGDDGDAEEVL